LSRILRKTIPTLDTERKALFNSSLNWSPSNIKIFGHSLNIDLPTGNLLISTSEVEYLYYELVNALRDMMKDISLEAEKSKKKIRFFYEFNNSVWGKKFI